MPRASPTGPGPAPRLTAPLGGAASQAQTLRKALRRRPAAAAAAPSPRSPRYIRLGPGGGKGKAANPGGSARPSLAHLQRGCTARLETLANFHLQRTCLKIRPKPELLQLSDFIQNSPQQLKFLKHPCQVYMPRLGHSEMCRFHRESSKSFPPAVLLKQSALFSLHVTVPSLRLLLQCTLGTG